VSGGGAQSARGRRRVARLLHVPEMPMEDAAHDERDRAAARRVSAPRKDARLLAHGRRRRRAALQPRRERRDQAAQGRWLAEDRRGDSPTPAAGGVMFTRVQATARAISTHARDDDRRSCRQSAMRQRSASPRTRAHATVTEPEGSRPFFHMTRDTTLDTHEVAEAATPRSPDTDEAPPL
jgi:hypothetical protein